MATPTAAKFTTDGKSVDVRLGATVEALDVVYAEGWLGIAASGGDSDDYIALYVDEREYIFDVGANLPVNKGDIVYVDPTSLEGNQPALAGYTTTAGGGVIPLFKATTSKRVDNTVRGILIVGEA
jgi:hypothetical protein